MYKALLHKMPKLYEKYALSKSNARISVANNNRHILLVITSLMKQGHDVQGVTPSRFSANCLLSPRCLHKISLWPLYFEGVHSLYFVFLSDNFFLVCVHAPCVPCRTEISSCYYVPPYYPINFVKITKYTLSHLTPASTSPFISVIFISASLSFFFAPLSTN